MKLLFTCDLDPLGVTIDEERNKLNWFDFMDLYKFRKCFSKYSWKMNWFIRADSFVEKFHNDIGWQYHNHISIWDDFRKLWIRLVLFGNCSENGLRGSYPGVIRWPVPVAIWRLIQKLSGRSIRSLIRRLSEILLAGGSTAAVA